MSESKAQEPKPEAKVGGRINTNVVVGIILGGIAGMCGYTLGKITRNNQKNKDIEQKIALNNQKINDFKQKIALNEDEVEEKRREAASFSMYT